MTQQLCEICKSKKAVATNSSAMGSFHICEKCSGIVKFVVENEYLDENIIPQDVRSELPRNCGGWDTPHHITEEPIIYLLCDKTAQISVGNIIYFCRSCLLEYMNDEIVQKI